MALATQCPHCYTSFRVANDQLKLHAGMVRCGSCQQTFNGIEHLLAPGQAPRVKPTTTPESTPSQSIDVIDAESEQLPTPSSGTLEESNKDSIEEDFQESADTVDLTANNSALDTVFTESPSLTEQEKDAERHVEAEDFTEEKLDDEIDHEIDDEQIDASSESADETRSDQNDTSAFEHHRNHAESNDLEFDEDLDSETDEANPQQNREISTQDTLLQEFSAKLETIEPELGISPEHILGEDDRLSSKIEFELTQDQKDLIEEADHLHQLELENRLAILDEDSKEWSKNEIENDVENKVENEAKLEPELAAESETSGNSKLRQSALSRPPTPPTKAGISRHQELLESTSDIQETRADIDTDESDVTPDFVLLAKKKQRYGKWQTFGFSLASIVLIIGILAQGAYFFRTSLAAQFPATKPYLVQACQRLSCQIKLPAERRMLEIAGSELLVLHDELQINTLSFQIQNKSNTVQEWPVAELILKDARGKIVLHKFIQPTEYLSNKAEVSKGIAARSESDHKIHFELDGLKASNYTVGIFYP